MPDTLGAASKAAYLNLLNASATTHRPEVARKLQPSTEEVVIVSQEDVRRGLH